MSDASPAFDRILVDGHNLVLRCAAVRGLSKLRDARGRPTGAIYGFLKSVLAFRKRFAGGRVVVVWDGSSGRRTSIFPEYKSHRRRGGGDSLFVSSLDPVAWLEGSLPLLGVEQARDASEEADDVIATLIRGSCATGRNVIVSTDRDFFQLASSSTALFVPSGGTGKKGKLIDPAAVEATWGVRPEEMLLLRAIAGDVSDNIPGCKGIGPKIAARFCRVCAGSVDALYDKLGAGDLAGFTKLQKKRLGEAEGVVRRNVSLMRLRVDVEPVMIPARPDAAVLDAHLRELSIRSLGFSLGTPGQSSAHGVSAFM